MTQRLGLIITDASPLITLEAAGALSCLLMPGVPVLIPDMVYAEITRDMTRLGADEIVDWLRANRGQVQIVATTVFAEFETLRRSVHYFHSTMILLVANAMMRSLHSLSGRRFPRLKAR